MTICAGVAFSTLCTLEHIAQAQLAKFATMDLDNQNHSLQDHENVACSLRLGEHVQQANLWVFDNCCN
jgi:hypothetical protein